MNIERSYFAYPWNSTTGQELRQVFGRIFQHRDEGDQSDVVTSQWAPQVDIREESQRFVIYADIPGVDPADIEISMEKSLLTIRGERKSQDAGEDGKLTRSERAHGVFYRRFALPDSAEAEGITASGKHGVLEIVIPKKAETTPRRIAIQSAT